MSDQDTFYGVDRQRIEAAMRKARRDRAEALRVIFRNLFNRSASQPKELPANICSAPLAH